MVQAPNRPNIVYIMADDMGWGDVSCFNPESRIPTPHMDRLAQQGRRFTDAHSPSAVCTPTRYGVLTGRFCWRSHLRANVLYGYEPPLIEPSRRTVANLLQDAGYHTAAIGKWHLGLGFSVKPGFFYDFNRALPWRNAEREFEEIVDFTQPLLGGPKDLGFDYFYGASGCPTCQPPYGFIEDRHFGELPSIYHDQPSFTSRRGMMAPSWEHKEADPRFAAKAVQYIKDISTEDAPFFLYLNADAPHEPCTRPDVPEFARDQSGAGPRGDLVWLFDWMVGQVMQALDETNQAEDTLVLVTSDNGALPGDRLQGQTGPMPYATYGHKSSADWRGYKAHIWEGGHREPLIARWPGVVEAGTTSDELVSLVDFMATCADITGQPLEPHMGEDSVSLLPALQAPEGESAGRKDLIHHSQTGVFSLRSGDWKAIFETRTSGGWAPPPGEAPVPLAPGQLYNLREDPGEEHNLWDTESQMVADLGQQMMGYRQSGRSVSQ